MKSLYPVEVNDFNGVETFQSDQRSTKERVSVTTVTNIR
jgi:hypothetical protein